MFPNFKFLEQLEKEMLTFLNLDLSHKGYLKEDMLTFPPLSPATKTW